LVGIVWEQRVDLRKHGDVVACMPKENFPHKSMIPADLHEVAGQCGKAEEYSPHENTG
jgi:hypothetical protein